VRREYGEGADWSPSEAVVDAVASAADVEPVDLPPLYEYVDGGALDQLFDRHDPTADTDAVLSFNIETWNVFVRTDGVIRVCDATRATEPKPVFEDTTA
jgi:hypothetical protein